jgi:hypothetical protein
MPHPRDAELDRLDRLAHRMDAAFRLPGTRLRIGADSIIGLVPGIGDALALAPAGWIIWKGRRMGAPATLQARMLGNAAIDGLIGSIPLVGDLFDVAWKANLRNVRLLRDHFGTRSDTTPDIRDEGPERSGAGRGQQRHRRESARLDGGQRPPPPALRLRDREHTHGDP